MRGGVMLGGGIQRNKGGAEVRKGRDAEIG